jgi:hypothetical protein
MTILHSITSRYNIEEFDINKPYKNILLVKINNSHTTDPEYFFIISPLRKKDILSNIRSSYITEDEENIILFEGFDPYVYSNRLEYFFKFKSKSISKSSIKSLIKIFKDFIKNTVKNKQLEVKQNFLDREINIKSEIIKKIKTYLLRYVEEEAEFKERKMEFEKRRREFEERKREFRERKKSSSNSSGKSSGYSSVNTSEFVSETFMETFPETYPEKDRDKNVKKLFLKYLFRKLTNELIKKIISINSKGTIHDTNSIAHEMIEIIKNNFNNDQAPYLGSSIKNKLNISIKKVLDENKLSDIQLYYNLSKINVYETYIEEISRENGWEQPQQGGNKMVINRKIKINQDKKKYFKFNNNVYYVKGTPKSKKIGNTIINLSL